MFVVTGGAGFIGSAIISYLNKEGIKDIIVVDEELDQAKEKNLEGKSYKEYLNKDEFLRLIKSNAIPWRAKCLLHMGACSSTTEKDVKFLEENNTRYSIEVAKWAISKGARFIYASSASTYGDGSNGYSDDVSDQAKLKPINPYGNSKHAFDLWAIENKFIEKIVGIKFFNVYGPNEYHKGEMRSMVLKSYEQVKGSGKIKLFKSYKNDFKDGEQKRDFIYIMDCLDVIWWFIKEREKNGLFNLGTGKARSWIDLAKSVFSSLKVEPNIEYIEMPEEIKNQYQYFTEANIAKLRNTGYSKPFLTLEQGVEDYITKYLERDYGVY